MAYYRDSFTFNNNNNNRPNALKFWNWRNENVHFISKGHTPGMKKPGGKIKLFHKNRSR
jgi:hypothetical protein